MPANAIDPEVAKAFVAEATAKIDEISAKLDALPADALKVRTIPAVTVGKGPDPVASPEAHIPPVVAPAAPAPAPDVPFVSIRASERTPEEIYNRVGAFLDPTQIGPLFVSTPIRRRIYFGKYPSFAEILSAEKVLGSPPPGASDEIALLWSAAGELAVAIRGFLFAHEPGIEQILAHPGDPSKWPLLRRFSLANNRDPHLALDIVELWRQYYPWKQDVTPTETELENFYGLPS